MKKLTTAILALLALTLTGCGNDNNRYVRVVDSSPSILTPFADTSICTSMAVEYYTIPTARAGRKEEKNE